MIKKIKGQISASGQLYAKAEVGMRGPSAYEVWLKEGNEGTVQDFLNVIGPRNQVFANLDAGRPDTNYGGLDNLDAGGVIQWQ